MVDKTVQNPPLTEHQDASLVQVIHKIRNKYPRSYENNLFIFFALLNHGPVSRKQLVSLTGLPRTTAKDGLERLETLELIETQEPKRTNNGRRRVFWNVNKCLLQLKN